MAASHGSTDLIRTRTTLNLLPFELQSIIYGEITTGIDHLEVAGNLVELIYYFRSAYQIAQPILYQVASTNPVLTERALCHAIRTSSIPLFSYFSGALTDPTNWTGFEQIENPDAPPAKQKRNFLGKKIVLAVRSTLVLNRTQNLPVYFLEKFMQTKGFYQIRRLSLEVLQSRFMYSDMTLPEIETTMTAIQTHLRMIPKAQLEKVIIYDHYDWHYRCLHTVDLYNHYHLPLEWLLIEAIRTPNVDLVAKIIKTTGPTHVNANTVTKALWPSNQHFGGVNPEQTLLDRQHVMEWMLVQANTDDYIAALARALTFRGSVSCIEAILRHAAKDPCIELETPESAEKLWNLALEEITAVGRVSLASESNDQMPSGYEYDIAMKLEPLFKYPISVPKTIPALDHEGKPLFLRNANRYLIASLVMHGTEVSEELLGQALAQNRNNEKEVEMLCGNYRGRLTVPMIIYACRYCARSMDPGYSNMAPLGWVLVSWREQRERDDILSVALVSMVVDLQVNHYEPWARSGWHMNVTAPGLIEDKLREIHGLISTPGYSVEDLDWWQYWRSTKGREIEGAVYKYALQ